MHLSTCKRMYIFILEKVNISHEVIENRFNSSRNPFQVYRTVYSLSLMNNVCSTNNANSALSKKNINREEIIFPEAKVKEKYVFY